CGDLMQIQIRVEDGILTDVKFKTFGCGAAIATSSMVTDLAIGKTIEEALKITRNDVAENLEGLPPVKMHCSNLAADALHAAIEDYLKKEGRGEWFDSKSTKKKSGTKKGARRRRAA
ncbi:MAG: iron-sulfur cluster assembly scaffold protein, partial [Halobacteriota archaeon]